MFSEHFRSKKGHPQCFRTATWDRLKTAFLWSQNPRPVQQELSTSSCCVASTEQDTQGSGALCPHLPGWTMKPWAEGQGNQTAGLNLPSVSSFLPYSCFWFWQSSFCEERAWTLQYWKMNFCQEKPLDPEYCLFTPAKSKCFSWQPVSKVKKRLHSNLSFVSSGLCPVKNLDKYCKPKKVCTLLRPVAINYFK